MPVRRGFRKWCAACEWNLGDDEPDLPRGLLARAYRRIGLKRSKALLEEYLNAPQSDLRPRMDAQTFAAWIISCCVHLVSLLIGGAGVYLIVIGWPKIGTIIIGCLLLSTFWLLRPRVARVPADLLNEAEYPELHALVADICNKLGVAPVRQIVVDADFNASIGTCSWRGVPLLRIGMPMWKILDDRQRVAMLAHEMSHRANGDPARGALPYSALYTLYVWHEILTQEPMHDAGAGAAIAELFTHFLALLVELIILAFRILLWRDNQKAEYLADYLATSVSGTDAMVAMLDRIRVGGQCLESIIGMNVGSSSLSGAELLERVRTAMDAIPEHECERIRRIDRAGEGSLDDTHPPTEYRIRFLEHRPIDTAALVMSQERASRISAEMASLEEAIGKKIVYAAMREY